MGFYRTVEGTGRQEEEDGSSRERDVGPGVRGRKGSGRDGQDEMDREEAGGVALC